MISFLFTGILASAVHVISGPDHIAAITPLAIESQKKSWKIGFSWGIGHTVGMLIIGLIFLLFKDHINVDLISLYGEQIVGFLLIAIGAWAIAKIYIGHGGKSHKHIHPHSHDDVVHIHPHSHNEVETHKHSHLKTEKQNIFYALGIGIIHGVAGVSHLIAILPTLAFPSKFDSVVYLSGFAFGTIAAMIMYSILCGYLGLTSNNSKKKNVFNLLRIFGGLLAIIVGIFWIYSSFYEAH